MLIAGDGVAHVAVGAEAHQASVECAPEAVFDDGVSKLGVAVAEAATSARGQVWGIGHALHAASDDDVGIAGSDHLIGEVDAVETRQAHLVDVDAGNAHGDASLDGGLT